MNWLEDNGGTAIVVNENTVMPYMELYFK